MDPIHPGQRFLKTIHVGVRFPSTTLVFYSRILLLSTWKEYSSCDNFCCIFLDLSFQYSLFYIFCIMLHVKMYKMPLTTFSLYLQNCSKVFLIHVQLLKACGYTQLLPYLTKYLQNLSYNSESSNRFFCIIAKYAVWFLFWFSLNKQSVKSCSWAQDGHMYETDAITLYFLYIKNYIRSFKLHSFLKIFYTTQVALYHV